MDLSFLVSPIMIPIVAILCGTLLSVLKHREKMAMIERGLLPESDRERERRLSDGGTSAVSPRPRGYNPGQDQPGPGELNRR